MCMCVCVYLTPVNISCSTHLENRDVKWKPFQRVKGQPSSSHPPTKHFIFHLFSNAKCASISEVDDILYSTNGKQGWPNWSQDLRFLSHFICVFNTGSLVGDRIQFYSLMILSCVICGWIASKSPHIGLKSQMLWYICQRTNSLAFLLFF